MDDKPKGPFDRARNRHEERMNLLAEGKDKQAEYMRASLEQRTKAANGCALAGLIGTMMVCITAIVLALIYFVWA